MKTTTTATTVQPGDVIEYREARIGVFGNVVRRVVKRIQVCPITGSSIPVVDLGQGIEWAVSEYSDTGRIVEMAPWYRQNGI